MATSPDQAVVETPQPPTTAQHAVAALQQPPRNGTVGTLQLSRWEIDVLRSILARLEQP